MAVGADQAVNTPTVLLTGASSQIGVFAIPRLLDAGFKILAVSRKGIPTGFPVSERVEWLNETEANVACQECQYLLCAGPLKLARKFLQTGGRFQTAVIFSSSSVESKQESDNPEENSQVRGMRALESELHSRAGERGIKLVIFRPTLIYGCGLDSNISRLASWIRRFGFMPLNGSAKGLRQPVHANDLASAATTALLSEDALPGVLNLVGGETLSYAEMVSRLFTALGKPPRLLRMPQWLFVFLVGFANLLGIGGGINTEMVRRQGVDLVFDDQQARDLLNYKPRRFAPTDKDFSLPKP